jgi:glycosyltransferase involved in cell wall biosynthesis
VTLHLKPELVTSKRVAVVTADTLASSMAGPAIRAFHIAAALSAEHEVELVTTGRCALADDRFRCRTVTTRDLKALERWCDVIIFQGFVMATHPWLRRSEKVLVVDVYDPFHLEQLEQAKDRGEQQRRDTVRNSTYALNDQLLRGDFFLCASEKQRDFWLGQLAGLGRVNPLTYDEDETMRSLIAVAPFGVSETAPIHTRSAIRGVIPGIGPGDKVILWGGGIYNWFDPLTLIRAVALICQQRTDVRLVFMGMRHPNPEVPEMRMAAAARALADSLGLTDKHVFFNEQWVAYEERQNYLLEADVGVSTHLEHVETAYSFRTRILDYLWAGLPIVCTRGDTFAELVERERLGLTTPPEDLEVLAEALSTLLADEDFAAECRKNVAAVAPQFSWSRALTPLVHFCRSPRRAPDTLHPELVGLDDITFRLNPVPPPPLGLRGDIALIRTYLRDGGIPLLAERVYSRLRRVAERTVRRVGRR